MAPPQGIKLLHSNIYREMLKKNSSQEPLCQFQPNLTGNMLGGMGIQICSNKRSGPFWGPVRGKIKKHFINLQKYSSHEQLAGIN